MRADAQFAVVEAVVKGFNKWLDSHGKAPQNDVRFSLFPPDVSNTNSINRSKSAASWNLPWKTGPQI